LTVPGAADIDHRGIEDEGIRLRQATLHAEVGDHAADVDLLVALHLDAYRVPQLQRHQLHQVAADLALVHVDADLAVRAAEQLADRVAGAGELDQAVQVADRSLRLLDRGEELRELQAAHAHGHLALDRVPCCRRS
jgi:hypothetical protein